MNNQLSDRIKSVTPSATLEMAAKARELRAAGKDIIGLSLGEPDFNTPDYIKGLENYTGVGMLKQQMKQLYHEAARWMLENPAAQKEPFRQNVKTELVVR